MTFKITRGELAYASIVSSSGSGLLNALNSFETQDAVPAQINYLADPPTNNPLRWLQYYVNDTSRSTMRTMAHRVSIKNARRLNGTLDLDREGFRLVDHRSAVKNYRDPAEVAKHQPAELEHLIRDLTGASATYGIGPQLRFSEGVPDADRDIRIARGVDTRPAGFVHGDFTDESIHWLADHWPGLRLDRYPRYACYNIWRAISPPPQNMPLAICDARTVSPQDVAEALAVMDLPEPNYQVTRVMTSVFRANSAHQWYYFPDMTLDEVLVFKSFDSDKQRANNVPHSAFVDTSCPAATPPRASAEIRVLAVFDH